MFFLLNKNISFNKNETESKIEKLTHSLREMNLVSIFFISMYSVLNKLADYTYFYISKTLLHTFLLLFFKSSKDFSVA